MMRIMFESWNNSSMLNPKKLRRIRKIKTERNLNKLSCQLRLLNTESKRTSSSLYSKWHLTSIRTKSHNKYLFKWTKIIKRPLLTLISITGILTSTETSRIAKKWLKSFHSNPISPTFLSASLRKVRLKEELRIGEMMLTFTLTHWKSGMTSLEEGPEIAKIPQNSLTHHFGSNNSPSWPNLYQEFKELWNSHMKMCTSSETSTEIT